MTEDEQAKTMQASMGAFLEGAWYVSVVDVETTLRHVCKKVLTDKSLGKDARKKRAQALVCGGMFANFTKATLLRPTAKVLAASHPEFRRLVDYEMFTPETIAKKCDAVLAEIK